MRVFIYPCTVGQNQKNRSKLILLKLCKSLFYEVVKPKNLILILKFKLFMRGGGGKVLFIIWTILFK